MRVSENLWPFGLNIKQDFEVERSLQKLQVYDVACSGKSGCQRANTYIDISIYSTSLVLAAPRCLPAYFSFFTVTVSGAAC